MKVKDLDPDTLRWAADYMKQNASVVLMFAHGRATDVWVYLLNLKASELDRSTPAPTEQEAAAGTGRTT